MKHVIFDCDGTLVDTSSAMYKLFPDVKELLLDLAEVCALYVWTARGRTSTLRILSGLGIAAFFDAVSTPDDAPPKPNVKGLFDLVGKTPKAAVCVIGDSGNDMLGAKGFGVLALGATWNRGARTDVLTEAGADFIVSHPADCSNLIRLNLKSE
jgi:phosphoglycolate phosphatase-like HAD superfamily hydrolase